MRPNWQNGMTFCKNTPEKYVDKLENIVCTQQKLERGRCGDGGRGENVQEENGWVTPELAVHPPASQSLQQHEYQSGAADGQD